MNYAESVTICVLLYGDYPALAQRCLASIAALAAALPAGTRPQLRIGMNAVSAATRSVVEGLFTRVDYDVLVLDSGENLCKYPIMRRMLYDIHGGVQRPQVMWFDDDSFIRTPTAAWLEAALRGVTPQTPVCGQVYRQKWRGGQQSWVKSQPWYGGKDPAERAQAVFVTGGWWCADMGFLRSIDYPWPALNHRGGDVLLGEAVFQQNRSLVRFSDGVSINAGTDGRSGSSARRGVDEPPLGSSFGQPSVVAPAAAPDALTQRRVRVLPRL